MTTSFQRARSEEQRAVRRQVILDTAAEMLTEMSVAELSLNELSRRVGLAKSNVLRYFESREAVLLELLDTEARGWLAELGDVLALSVEPSLGPRERGAQIAAAFAESVAARPVLCDLVGAQAAVLERNVSTQVAAEYKHGTIEIGRILTSLLRRHLPELSAADAHTFNAAAVLFTGSLWIHAHPSPAMEEVYASDPALGAMRVTFEPAVRDFLEVVTTGLLARAADRPAGPALSYEHPSEASRSEAGLSEAGPAEGYRADAGRSGADRAHTGRPDAGDASRRDLRSGPGIPSLTGIPADRGALPDARPRP